MSLNTARFRFLADALNGSGGFAPTVIYNADNKPAGVRQSHLVQYPRESEQKYARRNEVAWYENHLLPACQRFTGYLSKKPPARQLPHPLLAAFADDCNWRGDALDVFWQSFMLQAKARGCMALLVDMPRLLPDNAAEQIAQRAFPYLVAIAPEEIAEYRLDARGRFEFFECYAVQDGQPVIRGWDADRWWIRKGGEMLDGDRHGLGDCPVLAFAENGDFPSVGPFAQIADMSLRLFNARSELDEILRSQTFSVLTYQVPPENAHLFDARQTAEAIGTHNMLMHNGATPAFIAPSEGPANTYLQVFEHIERAIARASLSVEMPEAQSAESGLALTIRFQSLNAALTGFARRMEDLERNAWWLVSRWLGLNAVAESEWAKDYALSDIAAELQTLASMIAAGLPEDVTRQQKKVITQLAFPALPPGDMAALLAAIDQPQQEVTPAPEDGTA